MSATVRTVVLNPQADYAKRLRGHLMAVEGVKIAAEVVNPAEFNSAPERFRADVVMIDLDPSPEQTLARVAPIIDMHRQIHCFAISGEEDPKLILSCMRAGFREFLNKPVDHEQLSAAFQKVLAQKTQAAKFGKLINVVGAAGGVGSSFIACNLACEFAQISADKVALVDLDYDCGVQTFLLDMAPTFTIEDLAGSTERLEAAVVERALTRHATGVSVLPRPNRVGPDLNITPEAVNAILNTLQESFDFVVVDGPMRYDPTIRSILDNADASLLVVNLTLTSVRNADRILQDLGREGFNLERMLVGINRVGRESGGMQVEHVNQALNRPVSWQIPEDVKVAATSVNMGEPLVTQAPSSKLRQALKDLAENLVNVQAKSG